MGKDKMKKVDKTLKSQGVDPAKVTDYQKKKIAEEI